MQLKKGDVAVITGASRGLGAVIAREFARKGLSLVLAARSEQDLKAVAAEVRSMGVDVLDVTTDVSNPVALRALVDAATERFDRIDVLINNAGFTYTLPYDHVTSDDIHRTVAVNLTAPMLLTRLVMPIMIAAGRGHIVNIASLAGVLPTPYEELYTATKHGIVGFTRSLRASAKDRGWPISASVICPGMMDGAGIFEDYKNKYGVKAPAAVGSTPIDLLGPAVLDAIERDLPDAWVAKRSNRIAAALVAIAPRLFESLTRRMNAAAIFREIAQAHVKERSEDR